MSRTRSGADTIRLLDEASRGEELLQMKERGILILATIFLFLGSQISVRAATVYSISENIPYFGWLDQYSLDSAEYDFVGPGACVPTSATNAMTYLQNLAPGTFGTALTGTTYASWMETDATLASPPYMDTTPLGGTYCTNITHGLNKYIVEDKGFTFVQFSGMFPSNYWVSAPYDKPSYITDGAPTSQFLIEALTANKATIFSIEYGTGGGHSLLAGGINWTDLNDDGIIQESENATLSFVDPLDPSATYADGQPSGAAKFTQGHIWNKDNLLAGSLQLSYSQYGGKLPYSSGNYSTTGITTIDTAFVIAVPEPSGGILLLAGMAIVLIFCRRTRNQQLSGNAQG